MLPSTHSETHVLISICTPKNAYPRFYDAILSTKYFDDESELAYYGFRYYSPEMGRWVSRDPIGETAGLNQFVFSLNEPIGNIDMLGGLTLGVTKSTLTLGSCGDLSGYGDFTGVDDNSYIGKWVIQYVKRERKRTEVGTAGTGRSCSCCVPDDWESSEDFYEAFEIEGNAPGGGIGFRDAHNNIGGAFCQDGEEKITKTAVYFGTMSVTREGCPQGFTLGGSGDPTDAGGCWSDSKPSGWDLRVGAPNLVVIWGTESTWDCCPTENTTVASWF